MTQLTFDFIEKPSYKQLELFPEEEVFDNRIKRLNYSLRIEYSCFGWKLPRSIDILKECVRLFKASHEDVIKQYLILIKSEVERLNAVVGVGVPPT